MTTKIDGSENWTPSTEDVTHKEKKLSWATCRHDKQFRSKLKHTLFYLASFNAVGCVIGLLGPTFLDLQIISNTNVEQAARVFTSQSAGHMAGTLASGFLYDRLNRDLLLVVALVLCSLSTISIPWCSIFIAMIAAFAMRGLALGLIDTGSNSGTVQIWGKDSGPYMQALHFSFAVGAMLSPLLATPFLSVMSPVGNHSDVTSFLEGNISRGVNVSFSRNDVDPAQVYMYDVYQNESGPTDRLLNSDIRPTSTRVHYAYLIVGLWILTTSLPFFIRVCTKRQLRISKKRDETQHQRSTMKIPVKMCALALLGSFLFLYAGSFDCFSGFLMTFAVKQLDWTKPSGLLLTSAYWAAFAVSRGLAVLIARFLGPDKMIFGNYITLIGALVGIMFASMHSSTAMWICTVFVGLAMSSTFPAAFTWTERELFRVSGKLSAFLILSASTGTMVLPVLLGYLFQEHSKFWYLYLVLGSAIACTCIFAILVALAKCQKSQLSGRGGADFVEQEVFKKETLLRSVER
ncbi:sodium-dependent glucose transporter 1A-like [Liolophura sinensis]|uniref:sodium-dependent glucose transporter 1A-like n=1 Tax=Liolophura sinensis TaxID=3198878 RepID=UPI003159652D